jgi:hypothetical protein
MSDFASIYSMANKPTTAAPDLMEGMGKVASIQHMAQQNQQGAMQNQQMAQQLQDAQELRTTLQQAQSKGLDPIKAVSQLGSPAAQAWRTQYTDLASKQTKLSADQFKLATDHMAKVGGDVMAASQAEGATPQQVAQVIASHVQQGNIPPEKAQGLLQGLPRNPADLATWGKIQGATLGASKDLLGLFTDEHHMVDTGTGTQPVSVNKLTGKATPNGDPIEKDIAPGDLKRFASDIGALKPDGSIDMSNPQVAAHLKKMNYIAPNALTLLGGSGGAAFDPSQPLSPAEESQARYAAQTGARETPSIRNPGALTRNARAEYLAQQGGGDIAGNKVQFKNQQEATKYFTTGKGADAFRQQETIIHHADAYLQMATALDNGNMQLANKAANTLGVQLGNDKAKNLELAGHVLSEEVGKYLSGGAGSAEERATMGKLLPSFASPQQSRGAVTTLQTMVQGQRASWTQQRDAALKGNVPWQQQPANPQAGSGSTPTAAPALQKMSPQDAAKLPAGTHFLGLDGVERVKH